MQDDIWGVSSGDGTAPKYKEVLYIPWMIYVNIITLEIFSIVGSGST